MQLRRGGRAIRGNPRERPPRARGGVAASGRLTFPEWPRLPDLLSAARRLAANANFNLHLFSQAPTPTNGDNGAFAVDTARNFLGSIGIDCTAGAFTTTTDLAKVFTLT